MKKLLLICLMYALACIGARAGDAEITSWDGTALVIQTNEDADLETIDENTEKWGACVWGESWYDRSSLKIIGSISQIGLSKIESCMEAKTPKDRKHALDLSEAVISGNLSAIPTTVVSAVLPAGTSLDNVSFGNTSYVYSAYGDNNIINLYAGTVTTLSEIPELQVDDLKNMDGNVSINIVGANSVIIKELLVQAGVSETKISTPVLKEPGVCRVIGGSIKEGIEIYLEENPDETITKLIVTEGDITLEELEYLASDYKNLIEVDFADATLADDVRLPDNDEYITNWKKLILPSGTTISPNFKMYPDLIYAIGGAMQKIWIPVKEAGSLRNSGIAEQLPLGLNEVGLNGDNRRLGVALVGKVAKDDLEFIFKEVLKNAGIWNLTATEELSIDDLADVFKNTADYTNKIIRGLVLPYYIDRKVLYEEKLEYGQHLLGNMYQLSENEFTLSVILGVTETFDIARFTTQNTKKVVLEGNADVDEYIIKALKSTKRAAAVDLSGMTKFQDDKILSEVTDGTLLTVNLPSGKEFKFNIDNYTGTTFGLITRIRTDEIPNIAVAYQRVPGTLTKVEDYRSAEILNSEHIRYRGLLNQHDVENAFAGEGRNHNAYIDLSDVKIVRYVNGEEDEQKSPKDFDEETMVVERDDADEVICGFNNSYVKYLALPKGVNIPVDIETFKAEKCKSLISIGSFDVNQQKYSAYTFEEGNVGKTVGMFDDDDDLFDVKGIKHVVISGNVNAADIAGTIVQNSMDLGEDGHLYTLGSLTDETDIKKAKIQGGAFNGLLAAVESLDISNAFFSKNADMTLYACNYGEINRLELPRKMTVIPENCMKSFANMRKLYIPNGYEEIGKKALNGTSIDYIYTDDSKHDDGTVYMSGNNGENTITLPESLKKICTGALSTNNSFITDVYVLAKIAPVCEANAFSSKVHCCNNSYKGTAPISKDSYINNPGEDNKYRAAVLHFPTECDDENVKRYTDTTREYTLADGLGTTDVKGNLIFWPNQSEFVRAYVQGSTGYTWNSWKIQRADYESTEISEDIVNPDFVEGETECPSMQENADEAFKNNGSPENTIFYVSGDEDYRGWHQFVLTSYSNSVDEKPSFNFGKINDNDWWTICLPFNLTKSDIEKIYGEGTIVCTLEYVVRSYDGTSSRYPKNTITLGFGDNLMNNDGDVIEVGKPYMIKPHFDDGVPPSDMVLQDEKYRPMMEAGVSVASLLDKSHDVVATKNDKNGEQDANYTYKFIGSFSKYYIPQYSYFLGWDESKGHVNYFWQEEMPSSDIRNWNPYTCIIGVNWNNPEWILGNTTETGHWVTYTKTDTGLASVCGDDGFAILAGAKKLNVIFGGDETTGVYNIHTGDGITTAVTGSIYNINGQIVNNDGNTDNLPKGVYIVNGQKFVVK